MVGIKRHLDIMSGLTGFVVVGASILVAIQPITLAQTPLGDLPNVEVAAVLFFNGFGLVAFLIGAVGSFMVNVLVHERLAHELDLEDVDGV